MANCFAMTRLSQSWLAMCEKADLGDALNCVVCKYGILEKGLHTDNAREESSDHTEWEQVRKHFLISQICPWMNWAEGKIGHLKSHYYNVMKWHCCPETLWCFGMEYTSALWKQIACPSLGGRTPLECLTGKTPWHFPIQWFWLLSVCHLVWSKWQ